MGPPVQRALGMHPGDIEPIVYRIKMLLFHSRDAARDQKEPPVAFHCCKAVLNMINDDTAPGQDTSKNHKTAENDQVEETGAQTLADAADVIKRRSEYQNSLASKNKKAAGDCEC